MKKKSYISKEDASIGHPLALISGMYDFQSSYMIINKLSIKRNICLHPYVQTMKCGLCEEEKIAANKSLCGCMQRTCLPKACPKITGRDTSQFITSDKQMMFSKMFASNFLKDMSSTTHHRYIGTRALIFVIIMSFINLSIGLFLRGLW